MKGKFIKKLTAYALTAAMVVSTPMTAFASEFADNFWVSDGVDEHDPMDTGTGTVSSTNTDTTVLQHNANITGIVIKEKGADKAASSLVMDLSQGKTKTLVAEVQYATGAEISDAQKKATEEKITWSSSNLEIVRPAARWDDRATCPINAYKGGYASITASIDADNDGSADYLARVMVMVKKAPTAISWNIPNNTLYAGHTYDLMDYVSFGSADEFDAVEFTMTGLDAKKQKLVTFSKDGVLKLDKKIKNKDGLKVTLTAKVKGSDLTAEAKDIVLSEGVPVTGLSFTDKKPAYDIADNYDKTTLKPLAKKQEKKLAVTVKTTSGTTTDDITWSSSDNRIVRVTSKVLKTEKNDNKPFTEVTFEGLSVGKATVTATSTSGKSAKVNVTVTATLLAIESASIDSNATYSGRTTPVEVVRVPKQNNDKLKITIPKGEKAVKGKAGITPIITPVADLVKIGADNKEIKGVEIVQAKAPKGKSPIKATVDTFTVKQSDVKLDKVVAGKSSTDMNKQTVKMNSNRVVTYFATLDPKHNNVPGVEAVSWTSSKETVATVDNGRINVVGEGSAKITVSSVYKNEKGKYATIKKAFTIKSTPKCEEIILKSDVVTVKEAKAGKTVKAVINIKQQSPKKAADPVKWYIYDKTTGEMTLIPASKTVNDKKCTLELNDKYKAGDVITVIAMAGSAEVEAKVVVIPAK